MAAHQVVAQPTLEQILAADAWAGARRREENDWDGKASGAGAGTVPGRGSMSRSRSVCRAMLEDNPARSLPASLLRVTDPRAGLVRLGISPWLRCKDYLL